MEQQTTRHHELQVGEDNTWVLATAGMYDPARELLRKDQVVAAIEAAYEIRRTNYGKTDSIGIEFRAITITTTQLV